MAFNETCCDLIAAMAECDPSVDCLEVLCDALEEDGNLSYAHYRIATTFRVSVGEPYQEADTLLLKANGTFYMMFVEDVAVMLTPRTEDQLLKSLELILPISTYVYFNDCLYRQDEEDYKVSYDKESFFCINVKEVPMIVKVAIKYWKANFNWPNARLFA